MELAWASLELKVQWMQMMFPMGVVAIGLSLAWFTWLDVLYGGADLGPGDNADGAAPVAVAGAPGAAPGGLKPQQRTPLTLPASRFTSCLASLRLLPSKL